MSVYTRNLFTNEIGPGLTALFVVPAGELWIIRDYRLETFDAGDYSGLALFDGGPFVAIDAIVSHGTYDRCIGTNATVVVEEGHAVVAYTTNAVGLGVTLSGYKFTLP